MSMGNSYEVQACRGLQGACPFALWTDASVVAKVQEALRDSLGPARSTAQHGNGSVRHHMQFKVALAACPNACTLPQIQDVGIIAVLRPRIIRSLCGGCGACRPICREDAIGIAAARAELRAGRCLGCGACIRICPRHAIEPSPLQLRVLVGGRMGRHPRWAEQLCLADPETLIDTLRAFLEIAEREVPGAGRAAGVVERIGIERLREYIRPTACADARERGK